MATKANAAKREAGKMSAKKIRGRIIVQKCHAMHGRFFHTLNGVLYIEEETPGATDKWVSLMKRKHLPCIELKSYSKVPDEKITLK